MQNREDDFKYSNIKQLIDEKNSLQSTVKALTNEVEELSITNERFLSELQVKDFYSEYKQTMEELQKLKNAHMMLINMIDDQQVHLKGFDRRPSNKASMLN